ncbi:MAG: 50S ribosomal protein L22 [Parcubacteria group bacterium Gr01-1014_29]|nr:MAG: 50S ribosomal protein L22 [Parcubacteria group bacterium Gr01-1014_29]
MKTVKAQLKYARISPQKARRVADVIRGMSVPAAHVQLAMLGQRPVLVLRKLLASAVANAKQLGLETSRLIVQSLTVNEGPMFKRSMPRAHGRATPIRKRTSHIALVVGEKEL